MGVGAGKERRTVRKERDKVCPRFSFRAAKFRFSSSMDLREQ